MLESTGDGGGRLPAEEDHRGAEIFDHDRGPERDPAEVGVGHARLAEGAVDGVGRNG